MSVSDIMNEKVRMFINNDTFLVQTESTNGVNVIVMDTSYARILSELDVCGNMNLNNYDISHVNTLYATSLSGTLLTPIQPNITQVGTLNNLHINGVLSGPSTFIIDPTIVGDNTGLVVIKGSLQVDGTTTVINSSTVDISDHRILLASAATNDTQTWGAGIEISGNKTFVYGQDDTWISNINITAPLFIGDLSGNIIGSQVGGVLTTAEQPNITLLGNLTELSMNGNIYLNNNDISDVNTLYATSLSGTLLTPYQPNITGVGQLTINNAFTFPANIGTNDQILTVPSSGTLLEWTDLNTLINLQNYSDASFNIVDISNLLYVKGDASFNNNVSVTGSITASQFIGDGSLLTGINLAEFDDLSTNFIDLSTNYYSYVNANDTSVNNVFTLTQTNATDLSTYITANDTSVNNVYNELTTYITENDTSVNSVFTLTQTNATDLSTYITANDTSVNSLFTDLNTYTAANDISVNSVFTDLNTYTTANDTSVNSVFTLTQTNSNDLNDLSTNFYTYKLNNDTSVNNVYNTTTDLSTNYYTKINNSIYDISDDLTIQINDIFAGAGDDTAFLSFYDYVDTNLIEIGDKFYIYGLNSFGGILLNNRLHTCSHKPEGGTISNIYLDNTENYLQTDVSASMTNVYIVKYNENYVKKSSIPFYVINKINEMNVDIIDKINDLSSNYYTYKSNNDTSVNNVLSLTETYITNNDTSVNSVFTLTQTNATDLSTYITANDTSVNNVFSLTETYITNNDTSVNNVYTLTQTNATDLSTYITANDTSVNSVFTDLNTYITANDTSVNSVFTLTQTNATDLSTYITANDTSVNSVFTDLNTYITKINNMILLI